MALYKKKLIIFTRFPEPGTTKTRLIPALGPEGAASLQKKLTEQTLLQAEVLCARHAVILEIHFQGGDHAKMSQWLGTHTYKQQPTGSIGERMEQTFTQAFACGHSSVVIVGTDCPGLNKEILHKAFISLQESDLVLGPALDGGYYLIGLTGPKSFLFNDVDWGTTSVLDQTLTKANHLKVSQLTALHDIDRPEDLVHLNYHSHLQ